MNHEDIKIIEDNQLFTFERSKRKKKSQEHLRGQASDIGLPYLGGFGKDLRRPRANTL
jgi:hypothetical protein